MERVSIAPRSDMQAQLETIGFRFAELDGERYWDESAYYRFTLQQIEADIEQATQDLHALCLEAVERAVNNDAVLRRLHIPEHAFDLIRNSWRAREPSLYGRFDLVYDGHSPPKMLEYNADTPTSLFEAAVVQWQWLESLIERGLLPKGADQFNSIHDKLVARWSAFSAAGLVHFACMPGSAEDEGTIDYLAATAVEAGRSTRLLGMPEIGLLKGRFVDAQIEPINSLFKLYPWEWMWADEFGRAPAMRHVRFIEPPWKAILSNKGILPLLWALAPNHPNLLPAYFDDDEEKFSLGNRFAMKPLLSREGANVMLVDGDKVTAWTQGSYGDEGYVRQALQVLPEFSGNHVVIGSWVIGDEPAGIGLREDVSPVTGNRSRFLPHVIL